jgi:deoxycytidine triphosphate deaminase
MTAPSDPDLNYWREPPDKHLEPTYWADPWPELEGMLTSEKIVAYHKAIGGKEINSDTQGEYGMIRPFESRLLKPASYELTLGPRCLVDGQPVLLTAAEPRLIIPKNSIVFVSMRQVLCLPHYLVGRFDLAITYIYRGLLLGTGPQVDPGFQGGLGCPLHNISNEDIEMTLNEPFAKMDFVKTVPREPAVQAAWSNLNTELELQNWLLSNSNTLVKLFKGGKPEWREPIFGYTGGKRPRSSVQQLADDVRDAKTEVSEATKAVHRLRRIGVIAGLIGALTVGLAVAGLIVTALQLNGGVSDNKQELQRLRDCQTALSQRYEGLVRNPREAVQLAHMPQPSACKPG